MDVGAERKGLERKLTAGSLNVKEQRNFRNLISMQLDKVICSMWHNQSSTGLILKLKTIVSQFNGALHLGKGHNSGHYVGCLKRCEFDPMPQCFIAPHNFAPGPATDIHIFSSGYFQKEPLAWLFLGL